MLFYWNSFNIISNQFRYFTKTTDLVDTIILLFRDNKLVSLIQKDELVQDIIINYVN